MPHLLTIFYTVLLAQFKDLIYIPSLLQGIIVLIMIRSQSTPKKEEKLAFAQNIDDMLKDFKAEEEDSLINPVDYESNNNCTISMSI